MDSHKRTEGTSACFPSALLLYLRVHSAQVPRGAGRRLCMAKNVYGSEDATY
jgi:hypothetical protein